ncbi:unnamed protein product, partial [Meganyctiphanes norvegica]
MPVFVQNVLALAFGSCSRCASNTASLTWSHILSGCPSPTLSLVKRKVSLSAPSFPDGAAKLASKPLVCADSGIVSILSARNGKEAELSQALVFICSSSVELGPLHYQHTLRSE